MNRRPLLLPLVVFAAAAGTVAGSLADEVASAGTMPAHAAVGVGLRSIGSFDTPLFVTSPPGDAQRLFVVQQGGPDRRRARRQAARDAVPRPHEQGRQRRRAGPARARVRSRLRALSGCFYVYYTDRAGQRADRRVPRARAPIAPTRRARASLLVQADSESNHNGGMLAFGPDRLLYVGTRRRRRRRRPARRARQRAEPRHAARQDPPHRPAALGRQALHDPGVEPVRRPRRRARRDLRLRPAQPVAVLVRPRDRRPVDRRRRPGRGRGDRLRARAARARGANYGWRVWEGRRRNTDESAPGRGRSR